MTPSDFEYLRTLLRARSGLALAEDKGYLLESRLMPVARRASLTNLSDLVARLKEHDAEALATEAVEAMTTNESFFFRDKLPFDHFRDFMLPQLLAARAQQKRIRIWCAAAASGQEPYSLAMILSDMAGKLGGMRVDILATDLSVAVLERAKAGLYTQFEVQRGLPIQMLVKHFAKEGENWRISPAIRAMVQFRPLNLLRNFSSLGNFDIVFCRNVLIYFDQPLKIDVLERLAPAVAPDGYLSLGAAETVVGLTDAWKSIPDRRGLYARNNAHARIVPLSAARAAAG